MAMPPQQASLPTLPSSEAQPQLHSLKTVVSLLVHQLLSLQSQVLSLSLQLPLLKLLYKATLVSYHGISAQLEANYTSQLLLLLLRRHQQPPVSQLTETATLSSHLSDKASYLQDQTEY